mmetsp:Transcript_66478/g.191912  ORF Transcript_66478/g.191912 Transcript_66478/m.191912 type:complete len:639 (+) Transcript_66478:100-2016(+)|eukprot:CAMPEP_0176074440 /NCGR_PEP_ID=MMETSP0120_2-20121206/37201_1 /TAXON_ID=160619 /ORGANISM="Kryptoperidinium foliaceum, Strain CCMP 1326" /LENGTH=638 /DNA_ID=CAMNT_0017408135 /DNA_START=41 /DNA_END=1957 /DNA_ORIENTATION=+
MVEGTELTGVARTAATASAGLLVLGSILSIMSLALTWWTGTSELGLLANKRTVETEISLWSFDLTVGTPVSDGAGGTTVQTTKADMSWDQMCSLGADSAEGAPGACGQIPAIRAFAILAPLMGLPGTLALLQSRTVSPLLLVAGALLGSLQGIFAILGVVIGIMISTSGLGGLGVICLLGAAMVSFVGVSSALYGAGVAMPVDVPPAPKRMTRRDRVKDQLAKDEEMVRELEARHPAVRPGGFLQNDGDASEAETARSKKVPVMLKRVLFWSQEHSGDADAEGIPPELLEMAFQEIDTDGSGSIDLDELIENLQLCGLQANREATYNIMKEIDKDMSGDINIHEFVGFFRELEELDRYQAKTQQRAQFAQFLCNFCFIAHIIIVSVLLLEFINMEEASDPDGYLIFQNMLFAFSVVLAILLVSVICLPAIRLTLGGNLAAWQRQLDKERADRLKKKPINEEESSQGPRQAAWGTSASAAEGLTELTVNSAMFGASYRLSKQQNVFMENAQAQAQAQMQVTRNPGAGVAGSRNQSRAQSRAASKVQNDGSRFAGGADASNGPGVVMSRGQFERYDHDAYREAAMRTAQARAPTSFSPMQVRDMDLPRQDEPEMPGFLALEAQETLPGVLTGTGYYHREL